MVASGYHFNHINLNLIKISIKEKGYAAVAQLVVAPDCDSGGRWFKSTRLYAKNGKRKKNTKITKWVSRL